MVPKNMHCNYTFSVMEEQKRARKNLPTAQLIDQAYLHQDRSSMKQLMN